MRRKSSNPAGERRPTETAPLIDLRYGVDVIEGLRALPAESVQTVVTSPPYWLARDNRVQGQIGRESTLDAYLEKLVAVFREVRRVLRPDGTVWLNVGDKYEPASRQLLLVPYRLAMALQRDGWLLRSVVIWQKPGGLPRNVRNRPTDDFEPVFLLARHPHYYYDGEDLRVPSRYPAQVGDQRLPVTSNLRCVWSIVPENFYGVHTSIFPAELARRCILLTTPPRACAACGAPWKRRVDYQSVPTRPARRTKFGSPEEDPRGRTCRQRRVRLKLGEQWTPSCDCLADRPADDRPTAPAVVLDPFSGSGTTVGVAAALGRRGIGIDLSADYLPVAQDRIRAIRRRLSPDGPMAAGVVESAAPGA